MNTELIINPLFEIQNVRPSTSLRDRGFLADMCEFFANKIPLKLKLNFLRKKFTHYHLLDGPRAKSRGNNFEQRVNQ